MELTTRQECRSLLLARNHDKSCSDGFSVAVLATRRGARMLKPTLRLYNILILIIFLGTKNCTIRSVLFLRREPGELFTSTKLLSLFSSQSGPLQLDAQKTVRSCFFFVPDQMESSLIMRGVTYRRKCGTGPHFFFVLTLTYLLALPRSSHTSSKSGSQASASNLQVASRGMPKRSSCDMSRISGNSHTPHPQQQSRAFTSQ